MMTEVVFLGELFLGKNIILTSLKKYVFTEII